METAIKNDPNWFALLHYGVMASELEDFENIFRETYNEKLKNNLLEYAYQTFQQSAQKKPNHFAYRNLSVLGMRLRKDKKEIAHWWDEIFKIYPVLEDYALLKDYFVYLRNGHQRDKLWEIFCSLKENNTYFYDVLAISAAYAAIPLKKYKFLEQFFAIPHPSINEGNTELSDLWYAYQAQLIQDKNPQIGPKQAWTQAIQL